MHHVELLYHISCLAKGICEGRLTDGCGAPALQEASGDIITLCHLINIRFASVSLARDI